MLSRPHTRHTTYWGASALFPSTKGPQSPPAQKEAHVSGVPAGPRAQELHNSRMVPGSASAESPEGGREGGSHQLHSAAALSLPRWLNLY